MTKSHNLYEAKTSVADGYKDLILGVRITSTSKEGVLNYISVKCNNKAFIKPLFIITAYSEFFLRAEKDREFLEIMNMADLVIPDGVSVVAGADYLRLRSGDNGRDFWTGLRVGMKILAGDYVENKIEGVWLTRELLKEAGIKGWKVFLLGGRSGVAGRLAEMVRRDFKNIEIDWEEGFGDVKIQISNPQINDQILSKINKFKPDILFVAYGMPWQEKWIAANLKEVQAKVIMGVGSSFDEMMREGPWKQSVPGWVNAMGLKWLWRAFKDRKHWKRAWNAFPVFAWKVYRSK